MNRELNSRYKDFLEQVLTPDRLKHSFGVMQVMEELAVVCELDQEKAATAGLLHDAGKDLSPAQQKQFIEEAGLEIGPYSDLEYTLYQHGPVGAYFVRKKLGITDGLIFDAIFMHAFCGEGENFNSTFLWCLRFADILDPHRRPSKECLPLESRWFLEGKSKLRSAIYNGKILEAALFHTGWVIKMFDEKNFPIHPNMRKVYRDLSFQLKVDDAFWA
jgi:predicted HD superfamily hydrolase involved in NAD metabolism